VVLLLEMISQNISYFKKQVNPIHKSNRTIYLNLIKTPHGVQWVTIPVHSGLDKLIQDVTIANNHWYIKHWKTLKTNYSKATYFKKYENVFADLYLECHALNKLSQINYKFIKTICDILGIKTKLIWSMDYTSDMDNSLNKTSRVVTLCKKLNAGCYISGPTGRNYINEKLFKQECINLEYVDYSGYSIYRQLYGEFTHAVSILDLIFNEGPNAKKYMKSFE
jgi:hypothetical protein